MGSAIMEYVSVIKALDQRTVRKKFAKITVVIMVSV